MRPTRPSMQELIRQRRRAGFVGRGTERAAFRTNFDVPPQDERHRFLFHVHGNAGVGKTFLVRELEQVARERGALTAYVDDSVGSVPETMAALSRQFAAQGHRFKELDRLLAAHRERRHEAEAAAITTLEPSEPEGPSAGSRAAARAGLVGLGMVPGAAPFVGVLDADRLAQGADRLRAGISARFRNPEDVQLVLSPERVLSPVLLAELADAAAVTPWAVLFFDTYERTGPFLDGWLHELMTTDRHGALPANVIVVTAGQLPFDTARWGGFADFVADIPLAPFTETETRGLLADKGVVAEPVVAEVLRLTGGLPVLVSTLAETRPADPDDVGDPSATAVERFLKWEQDPVRRAVALACALPRRLDADVFRAAVECPQDEAEGLFAWLRGLPFVSDRGDRVQYHDVVRAPMLRLQRMRSPRGWAERQRRLAEVFARWRTEAEDGRPAIELWADEGWRELRLAETYHLLCAGVRGTLPEVLAQFVLACDAGEIAARRWARALADAGQDADAQDAGRWGRELTQALASDGIAAALELVLHRAGFNDAAQAFARTMRGRELQRAGAYEEALAEFDRAVELNAELVVAHIGRAVTRAGLDAYEEAIADLDRAVELDPDRALAYSTRGEYHRIQQRYDKAIRDLDEAIRLDPTDNFAWASRGASRSARGEFDAALADLDRALELKPDYAWALVRRAQVWRGLGDPVRQLADLDRAIVLQPDWAWSACHRGDLLRIAGRYEEALTDYDRAIELDDEYASAYASRGACRRVLGRCSEALADLDRAVELNPDYAWALSQRALVHCELTSYEKALADVDRARELRPDDAGLLTLRGGVLNALDRFDEARADLDRALGLAPDHAEAYSLRSTVLLRLGLAPQALADLDRRLGLVASAPLDEDEAVRLTELTEALLRAPDTDRLLLAPLLARLTSARDGTRTSRTTD
ncbi:tetratricopeptide repeat protein [Streptomyces sp. NPDC005485]|uniref:tetratricopeptide repeat protein n=1 Tax=Streptomyces sp. NPDC005485 TaxID=3155591 RepID=UPI0033B1C564